MTCFRNNHSPGKIKHNRLKSQIIKKFLDHLLKVEKTHESCFVFRSLKKFIFRYQYLVEIYSVSAEKIISDAFSYSENV